MSRNSTRRTSGFPRRCSSRSRLRSLGSDCSAGVSPLDQQLSPCPILIHNRPNVVGVCPRHAASSNPQGTVGGTLLGIRCPLRRSDREWRIWRQRMS